MVTTRSKRASNQVHGRSALTAVSHGRSALTAVSHGRSALTPVSHGRSDLTAEVSAPSSFGVFPEPERQPTSEREEGPTTFFGHSLALLIISVTLAAILGCAFLNAKHQANRRATELVLTKLVTRDVVQTMAYHSHDPDHCHAVVDPSINATNPFPYPPCPSAGNPIKVPASRPDLIIEYCDLGPQCVGHTLDRSHCTVPVNHTRCPIKMSPSWITSCKYGFYVAGQWIQTGELNDDSAGYQSHHKRDHVKVAYLAADPTQFFFNYPDCFNGGPNRAPTGLLIVILVTARLAGNYFGHWQACNDFFD